MSDLDLDALLADFDSAPKPSSRKKYSWMKDTNLVLGPRKTSTQPMTITTTDSILDKILDDVEEQQATSPTVKRNTSDLGYHDDFDDEPTTNKIIAPSGAQFANTDNVLDGLRSPAFKRDKPIRTKSPPIPKSRSRSSREHL